MKSSCVFVLILFTNFLAVIHGTRITFVPKKMKGRLSKFYLDKTNSESTSSQQQTFFTSLSNKDRKQLCLNTVFSTTFEFVAEEGVVDLINVKYDAKHRIQKINEYYNNKSPATREDHITMDVDLHEEGFKQVTGIVCSIDSQIIIAIEDGYDKNQYFVIGQKLPEKKSFVVALVEEITTTLDEATRYNQEKLEKRFLSSSQEALDNFDKVSARRNICHMDKFNKIRACISVYTVWAGLKVDPNTRTYIRENDENLEIGISSIQLFSKGAAKSHVEQSGLLTNLQIIDMIPCSINTNVGDGPTFYLTADQLQPNAVFVLTHLFEKGEKKYKIITRVENVLGLETLPY